MAAVVVVVVVSGGSGMRWAGGRATVQQAAAACQAARLDCETKARRAVVGTARSKQRAQAEQMRAD